MPTTATADPSTYRFARPTVGDVMRDMYIPAGDLGPGDEVPDFDLPTLDHARFSSSQFDGSGRPTLIVFGSLTCPVTESAGAGLVELHRRYGEQVRFVVINTREAHPGEVIPQPSSFDEKRAHASKLRDHHEFDFEVAIDDIDGTVHRAFGTRPSSAYLVDVDGTVLFRAQWSNVTAALDDALAATVAGRPIPKGTVARTPRAMAKLIGHAGDTLDDAGPGAMRDTWLVAPPVAAMIRFSRLFAFLPKDRRGLPTMATMSAIAVGLIALLARSIG